ncbi:hypothetical protein ACFXKD_03120 [Nocardiopsis aegyptia]|uniref:hypothetical protein n=1 Tax=Nocardiopsis aegyptia TaxID=220378 RepID=UPI00366E53D2
MDEEGDGRLLTIFRVTTSATTDEMVLGEGQAMRAYGIDEVFELNLATFCRRVLTAYRQETRARDGM